MMRLFPATTIGMCLLAPLALAADQPNEVLRASATLYFERGGAEVFANFDLSFTNTTGQTICVRVGQIPGSGDFDPSVVEFHGPRGVLPVENSEAAARRHYPNIDKMGLRVVAFFRGAKVRVGYRISRDDYVFKDVGDYRAILKIEAYDCAKFGEISSVHDTHPGWFLGHIIAEASATLR